MEQKHKRNFNDIVKSEIQDKDESLSKIPDLWGENHLPLIETYSITTLENNTKVGLKFNEHYSISDSVKARIKQIFDSDSWLF